MPEYSKSYEIIARAVIIKDGKILMCKGKERDYYFFPGGHVEKGEKTEIALKREFLEEVGSEVGNLKFIGAAENIFSDNYEHHELNLVFEADAPGTEFKSREDHLVFELLSMDEFKRTEVLPASLKNAVLKWLEDGKIFWRSE